MRCNQHSRIMHLIKGLGRGGAEVLLTEGLLVANRTRFTFHYGYFLSRKDAVASALREQRVDVTCFEATSNVGIISAAYRVAWYIRENNIDLVHAHLPVAGIVSRLAGRLTGVPVIYTEHNLQERYHPATRWLNLRTWRLQAEAVAVSGEVAESIDRHVGAPVPVHTILNGVNVRSYDPATFSGSEVRVKYNIPPKSLVVGTIAVFRVQKRLDDWLRVARLVVNAVPGTHFLLVGDGPERSMIEARVAELCLQEVVHFAGLQEETRPFFAAMDVYLMTSQFEGLPIALLEAMSMGIPPVVTSVGGIPELVRSGENGEMQPFGAIEAIAADVVRLLGDLTYRRRIGYAARETVVRDFSMERMQRELEAIYERVIAEYRRK